MTGNKEDKYKDPLKVVVREIKVLDRDLADSLLLEIRAGLDFEKAAVLFSKTNPSRGGLMQPFVEGKYNDMGRVAFSLKTNLLNYAVVLNIFQDFFENSIYKKQIFLPL
mgnify:CR=1 FL=1